MENMDKGLMGADKPFKNTPKFICLGQAQKIGILMKKGFIGCP